MKELMILMVNEIESSVKKTFPFYDMVEMLCFLLGIYGERIFLHIYMCLKKMEQREKEQCQKAACTGKYTEKR